MTRSRWFVCGNVVALAASIWGFVIGHYAGSAEVDAVRETAAALKVKLAEAESHAAFDLPALQKSVNALRRVANDRTAQTERFALLQASLSRSEQELATRDAEIALLQEQLSNGFVQYKRVVLTEAQSAYALVPPKLMLSVDALRGGPLTAHFGNETADFVVGKRVDFNLGPCDCFLVLMRSTPGSADFAFGCDERTDVAAPEPTGEARSDTL